jgi:hypothetical protein
MAPAAGSAFSAGTNGPMRRLISRSNMGEYHA